MKTRGFWCLEGVSDRELQCALSALLASSSRTEARIIAHLAEVEERRIHLKAGSESLFAYCTKRLGSSNNEAFHRIAAARVARRFPVVFRLLEQRELHLTAICLLRDHLTPDNHAELLAEASRRTKWQIQELIARRFPQPDAESRIRKLPAQGAVEGGQGGLDRVSGSSIAAASTSNAGNPNAALPSSANPSAVGGGAASPIAVAPVVASATPVPAALVTTLPRLPTPALTFPVRGLVEPTSASRYRIQLNASAALKEKLDLLRALTSHSNPDGDLAALIERPWTWRSSGFSGSVLPRRSGLASRRLVACFDRRAKLENANTSRMRPSARSQLGTSCDVRTSGRAGIAARRARSCRSITSTRGPVVATKAQPTCACCASRTTSCSPNKTSAPRVCPRESPHAASNQSSAKTYDLRAQEGGQSQPRASTKHHGRAEPKVLSYLAQPKRFGGLMVKRHAVTRRSLRRQTSFGAAARESCGSTLANCLTRGDLVVRTPNR